MASKSAQVSEPAATPPKRRRAGSSLREELKAFTRERIISAAMESFQQQGFRDTSIERIVELAGTTAPTFYRHFTSKNDLLLPLQEYLENQARACLAGLGEEHATSPAALRVWMLTFLDMWERNRLLLQAYWDALNDPELARQVLPRMLSFTNDVVNQLGGRIKPMDVARAKLRINILTLSLDRIAFLVNASDSELAGRILDEFADIMWAALFEGGTA